MTPIRCPRCGRLLFKSRKEIAEGKIIEIEIQCPKCGCKYTWPDKKK